VRAGERDCPQDYQAVQASRMFGMEQVLALFLYSVTTNKRY